MTTLAHPDLHPRHWLNLTPEERLLRAEAIRRHREDKARLSEKEAKKQLRAKIRKWEGLLSEREKRFYISFSVKGSYNPQTNRYDRYVWLILFRSHEEAELAMDLLPIFANARDTTSRGRIISAHIERVLK